MLSDTSSLAIRAESLGKAYALGEQSNLMSLGRNPPQRLHWALEDISFDIHHGEAVGIIGHNGAGKSTLLKLLARITEPTRGQATIYGRVASLLEVGTGFHPELTGRENIFMNGSILGMKRAEIARHFDEIVDFAGVEKFIDTPVKRYSSGMQMRLAFSVAAHLQPEILIIDEVLAVGDVQFQKKCMGKMGDVSRSGRTVLFVSHNMAAVRQLTTRCILLSRGSLAFDGASGRAVERYSEAVSKSFTQGADLSKWPRVLAESERIVAFQSLSFSRPVAVFSPEEPIFIDTRLKAREAVVGVRVSGTIYHSEGYPIGSFFSQSVSAFDIDEERTFRLRLSDLRLAPGLYSFALATGVGNSEVGLRDFDILTEVLPFEIGLLRGEGNTVASWPSAWGAQRFGNVEISEVSNAK